MGRKRIDWDSLPLGEVTDSEIAKALQVDRSTVSKARLKRGIRASKPFGNKGIDWDSQPLGKVTDSELAEEFEVSIKVVAGARRVRNIDPYVQTLYEKRSKSKIPAFDLTIEQREDFKKYNV